MTIALDSWWLRMFRRLLDAEVSGAVSSLSLASRWLALDQHAFASKRRPRWVVGLPIPEDVAHFLDDADVRAKDAAYAQRQYAAASAWLRAVETDFPLSAARSSSMPGAQSF